MSAQIVDLASFRASRVSALAVIATGAGSSTKLQTPFQFWSGATGTRYVHTIYSLIECPPVAASNYILVKRHSDGRRTVLSIGRLVNECATLNLAEIRRRSAELGANEVHIHMLADGLTELQAIEADLRRSLVIA
jgi:hypothetical protein